MSLCSTSSLVNIVIHLRCGENEHQTSSWRADLNTRSSLIECESTAYLFIHLRRDSIRASVPLIFDRQPQVFMNTLKVAICETGSCAFYLFSHLISRAPFGNHTSTLFTGLIQCSVLFLAAPPFNYKFKKLPVSTSENKRATSELVWSKILQIMARFARAVFGDGADKQERHLQNMIYFRVTCNFINYLLFDKRILCRRIMFNTYKQRGSDSPGKERNLW